MVVSQEDRFKWAGLGQLGVDKGDSDVACALGGGEPFMVVREPSGVHQGPPFPWSSDGAVVAQEATSPTLEDRSVSAPTGSGSFFLFPVLCPPMGLPQPSDPWGKPCGVTLAGCLRETLSQD